MPETDLALIAHLLRRAGFSATRREIEKHALGGYEALVADLVNPERFPDVEEDLLKRYFSTKGWHTTWWSYRMAHSQRPLQEKMVLFWHQLFPTSLKKSGHFDSSRRQLEMFRQVGLTDLRTVLTKLSCDPAMIYWLDNNENYKEAPNENYGRELLELFSMGVGNYTEEDVKSATQAFTGWTIETSLPGLGPTDGYPSRFIYQAEDHDSETKCFLGEKGKFNGEDILDVIVKQPASARFLSRQLYTFFVADEPAVASWNEIPSQDPEAIDALVKAYFESGGDLRHILTTLFNSEFFKQSLYKKVKSPIEMTMGILKLLGGEKSLEKDVSQFLTAAGNMGMVLMGPPTVEGWHTGVEWIDGGTLNERINFAVDRITDTNQPVIQMIVDRLAANRRLTTEEFVDTCLEFAGPISIDIDTKDSLLAYATSEGNLSFENEKELENTRGRVVRMLRLIVSTREYQFN